MQDKLTQLLRDGEGLTVEFKRCTDELANSVYETVSSFSNRYGGYILLGVSDNGSIKMSDKMSDNGEMSDKMSDKVFAAMPDTMPEKRSMPEKHYRDTLLAHMVQSGEISAAEAAEIIGRSVKTAQRVL